MSEAFKKFALSEAEMKREARALCAASGIDPETELFFGEAQKVWTPDGVLFKTDGCIPCKAWKCFQDLAIDVLRRHASK